MQPPTILVVDDEPLIRWSLTERLVQDGYRVVEADTARTAVERHREGVDLVFCRCLQCRIQEARDRRDRRRHAHAADLWLAGQHPRVAERRRTGGILHDLSARVRMEEELREQTSLARLGEMAAVMAHEVKNPLAGIRGAIQVIGSRLPAGSKDAAVAKEIVSRIDALNELMKDLLRFARPPQARPATVDVGHLLATTVDLMSADPALKELRVHVEGSVRPIQADPELLKIVFMNLLVNGAHAMQGRGVIRVAVGSTGGSCRIVFEDAGPGIPPDVRDKIFTPFFTTKSRGTGLGLPTAKRFVEVHGGTITVACPPGGGTIVTVQLPA